MPSPTPVVSDAEIRQAVLTLLDAPGPAQIVQAGHPVLRQQARDFTGQLDGEELEAFLELMRLVMHDAPGVGLAAPQLGIPLRIAVLEDQWPVPEDLAAERDRLPLPYFAILNPRYRPLGDGTASFFEGCLSVSGLQAVVRRPDRVELEWTEPGGSSRREEFHGWQARIVQHETDHLDGTLYVDKAVTRSLCFNSEYGTYWAAPGIEGARTGLGFDA
ncbi:MULTISPECIES: peptide deformylase [Arthrobacter]|uniref:Peptide deformylase n=2 Tax=Arthrobacter TaxID=1663 RepID=A0ABU9KHC4_9MICC|nr:peptide deformylase [Arthrobacter sp. YJM1]MDP5225962.1 peptide deformylase [Arthrobacter sp. YJM1]